MKIFDAQTWVGRWPFTFQSAYTPRTLMTELGRHRIGRALVSSLDAVFAPEPRPANRALLKRCKGQPALVPVPIINPALANWREQLDEIAGAPSVSAVRLLPAYHNYRLGSRAVDALVSELRLRGLKLVLSIRLVDERHDYFALKLRHVRMADLAAFLKRHDGLPVLASGLVRAEVISLLPKHRQLVADLSLVEWFDTLAYLLRQVEVRQLVFASHTPFLITAAAAAKLGHPTVSASALASIASGNLDAFLKP